MLLRRDLIRRRVAMGSQQVWVLKDPLSRQLFYFSEQEYQLLELANGERSLSEISKECKQRFAPKHFSSESLARFYSDAQQKGLLGIHGARSKMPASKREAKTKWNLLAIRLPGFNPDRLLERFVPLVRPLMSPPALIASAILMMAAAFVVVVRFDSFVGDVRTATANLQLGFGLILLLLVISITKIIHELSHAFVCRVFGGECRELGVMLLVGVPCLYCDVSDAWLMEGRWKRVFVSAAGMLAELTLAALATFVWLFANDGIVQDLCVMIMVVCSATTVLFNGNPLLRYDGYYMLSDLTGTPNLAMESSSLIRQRLRQLIWDLPRPLEGVSQMSSWRSYCLMAYAVASGGYRLLVYGLICLMLYRIAEDYQFYQIAAPLVAFMFARVLYRMVSPLVKPPQQVARLAYGARFRPALIMFSFTLMLVVAAVLPMPRSVVAPMSIQPANAKTVFVSRGGEVHPAAKRASHVQPGDVIARLQNTEAERELASIDSRCDQLAKELQGLRSLRGVRPEVSARIPSLKRSLEEALARRETLQRLLDQFVVRSPSQGRLFAPHNRNRSSPMNHESEFWAGYPMDEENRGAWMQDGTVLGVVGDPDNREATLLLRQQEIELVRVNQAVSLLLPDHPRGSVRGRVVEVAGVPVTHVPSELSATGLAASVEESDFPRYQVRVRLDRSSQPLPVRLTGQAQISVESASIFKRLSRFISDSFG